VLLAHKVLLHRVELAEQEPLDQQEIPETQVQRALWDIAVLKEFAATQQILVTLEERVLRVEPAKPEPLETLEIRVQLVLRVEPVELVPEAQLVIQATPEIQVQHEPVQLEELDKLAKQETQETPVTQVELEP
jgi:hypothetical protein